MDLSGLKQLNQLKRGQLMDECVQVYEQILAAQQLMRKLRISKNEDNLQQNSNQKHIDVFKVELDGLIIKKNGYNFIPDQNILFQDRSIGCRQYQIREAVQLNSSLQKTQQFMLESQNEYKQLMRKHYKFVRPNKAEQVFSRFIRDKLLKNIENVQNQMRQIYEMGTRSSISGSSLAGNCAIWDWVNRQKQQKMVKQQQKLQEQVAYLEEQLTQI